MANLWFVGAWPEEEFGALRSALEEEGYSVNPPPGQSVEVAEVITEDPDLVVMLQRLPEADQIPSLMLIREFNPDVPVAILTNTAQKENLLKAKKYGVGDFWVAPIDTEKILPRVRKIAPVADKKEESFGASEAHGVKMEEGSPYVEVPINQIIDGLMLAQPVEVRGAIMLHQGTAITQAHVDRLSRWGVESITVMRKDYEKFKGKKGAKTIAIPEKKQDIWEPEIYKIGTEMLPVGQMIDFSTEGGAKFLGNLDDVSPKHLVIGLPSTERSASRLSSGARITGTYQTRGAGFRFDTSVVQVGKSGSLYLKHPSRLMKKQLRGAVREDISLAFTVWVAPAEGEERQEVEATMSDISAGGCGFKSREKFEKGQEVFLNFELEDGLAFDGQPAALVRVQELRHDSKFKYNYGAVFSNMPEFTKERIMKYIFKLQREKQQVGQKRR